MIRYLSVNEDLRLHERVVSQSGGSAGVRDHGAIESAVAQPRMIFGGHDLYDSIEEKAAALGFSLVKNHPFVDGNKRIGHAATELMLVLNGLELRASVDDAERTILQLAAGAMTREDLVGWVRAHAAPRGERGPE